MRSKIFSVLDSEADDKSFIEYEIFENGDIYSSKGGWHKLYTAEEVSKVLGLYLYSTV